MSNQATSLTNNTMKKTPVQKAILLNLSLEVKTNKTMIFPKGGIDQQLEV